MIVIVVLFSFFFFLGGIQELADPLVVEKMNFYPQDSQGKDISSLYQSAKWTEHLSPQFWVQMVPYDMKHFYIYEPVTLPWGT